MRANSTTTVLVTGGAGYIGSHTSVELIKAGYDVVIVDNLSVGRVETLDVIEQLTGVRPRFHNADIRNKSELDAAFRANSIDAVIHFAAKKAVGESTEIPLQYFDNNVAGTATLLHAMQNNGVNRLVFSSSCSIYGDSNEDLLNENSPSAPANPYAWTKLACEQMITQACQYIPPFRAVALRYFNPIGAHESGLLGEDPDGVPRNIMPYLTQVAIGHRPHLRVFGGDYATPDGSAIRDYVHVEDIARGHINALDHVDDADGMQLFNLGTGIGTSVLELATEFARSTGRPVPVVTEPRRDGDVPRLVADPRRVQAAWGWRVEHDIARMCRDAWRHQERLSMGTRSAEQERQAAATVAP